MAYACMQRLLLMAKVYAGLGFVLILVVAFLFFGKAKYNEGFAVCEAKRAVVQVKASEVAVKKAEKVKSDVSKIKDSDIDRELERSGWMRAPSDY